MKKQKKIKKALSDRAKSRTGSKNHFYGKKHSDETKQKIREANLGKKPINCRKVEIDNIVYDSVTEASRKLKVVPATIIYRIKSEKYPTYKYIDAIINA